MSSPTEPDEPVIVAQPTSEVEGAIMRGALEAEGIPAWVVGGLTSGFRAEAPGRARLLVRAADAARAREILSRSADAGQERLDGGD